MYSTYFDQFSWSVSLGSAVSLILPFIFMYSTMSPMFMSSGSLELVSSVGILSLSKVLCSHAWAKKAGSIHLLVMVGVVLFYCNMVGMIPFIKGVSVIPAFVLSLGFAVWSMGSMGTVLGLRKFSKSVWVMGAPGPLNFFIFAAELLSWCIRPFVLGIRLLVNITCGHIIMSLLGELSVCLFCSGSVFWAVPVISLGVSIGVLEWLVMFVQVVVFVSIIAWSWGEGTKLSFSFSSRVLSANLPTAIKY